jgi:DNA replication protein DnaC
VPCSICDDTGWKTIEVDGVSRVTRCDCIQVSLRERRLKEARIPPRYQRCTLDNLVTYENELFLKAVEKARRFVEQYPVVDKGLMLIGPPGIGKTHIAVAVLRQVINGVGARGLYYDTRYLLRDIRSTYNPTLNAAEMDVLRPVMEAELLVLDDLGAERLTDWVEETMNLIVNTRYNERRPTIFTSNHEDIPAPDDTDMNSLLVRVGFRMHSRLREMCDFLEYDGPDYRDLPPNVGSEDLFKLWKGRPRRKLPPKTSGQARAQLRARPADGRGDLKWPGGRAGT